MREPSCYGGQVRNFRYALGLKRRKEITATRINRRALLAHSGAAVLGSSVTATAYAGREARRDPVTTNKLQAMLEAYMTA
jgi:hypothetical protein